MNIRLDRAKSLFSEAAGECYRLDESDVCNLREIIPSREPFSWSVALHIVLKERERRIDWQVPSEII